ncbi:MAG: sialic acid TRAP transporter substrate-binding protein SiaP [Rhodospirillales bacterium]|nr:sialic acid TRAP transporter substrate-binding protein SiaP [Rhodospirillales bacterium]
MKTTKIWRRSLLVAAAALLFVPFAMTAQPAAAEKIKIRISTPAVPGDWHAEQLYVFKEYVERSLPDQFDVQVFLNATLFKQGAEPAQMKRGNLDMAMISAQDIAKQLPQYSIFTAGYLIQDPEHQKAVFYGGVGNEYFQAVSDKMDVTVLAVAYLGTRQLNLRDVRDVKTPADLKGVKLRMPGSKAWQFLGKALGAAPTPLAFGEVYLSLKTGAIDGQDNPLPTDQKAKFYEVTKQIVLTSHLVDGVFLAIGNKSWNKLNDEQKAVFYEGARLAADFNNNNRIRDEARLVDFFKSKGMTITTPDRDAFRKEVQEKYMNSEFSKSWPKGLMERINTAGK